MKIDSSNFPIVYLDYGASSRRNFNQILLHLKQLLERKQPFVIIGSGASDHDDEERNDDRRKISFWTQANRQAVQKYIKVHLYVASDIDNQKKAEAFAQTFEDFWGYPMVVVNSREEALAKAQLLLQS